MALLCHLHQQQTLVFEGATIDVEDFVCTIVVMCNARSQDSPDRTLFTRRGRRTASRMATVKHAARHAEEQEEAPVLAYGKQRHVPVPTTPALISPVYLRSRRECTAGAQIDRYPIHLTGSKAMVNSLISKCQAHEIGSQDLCYDAGTCAWSQECERHPPTASTAH